MTASEWRLFHRKLAETIKTLSPEQIELLTLVVIDGYAYVIEQKIKDLKQDMEDMITMSMRTEGDTEKFEAEIRKISDQLCAMRNQLEVARSQTQASEKVNQEIESIKAFLADTEINFSEYNEIVVRKLIECIRVMPDGKLVIVLKGGITIEEQIAA